MNTKALWSVTILGTVAAFFSACGDGDSTKIKICNAKQLTCLSDTSAQICSADGTVNLPFTCGEGQHCCDPHVKDADCGEGVTKASCVGDCKPGDTQCGSKGVALRCADDGRHWITTDCPVGTGCDSDNKSDTYGTCVNSDDPANVVVVCEGGATACADDSTAKSCEPDGTNWVYIPCAANELCDKDKGECVLDPAKGCVPHAGTCVDKTHVKMCNDKGDDYDKVEACPKGTTCEDGACQGPVCAVDEYRCDDMRVGSSFVNAVANGTYQPGTLYHCNADGTAWETSTCAPNEICVYDNISNNTVNTYIEDVLTALRNTSGSVLSLPVLAIPTSSRASCESPGCAAPYALRGILSAFDSSNLSSTAGSFTCGDPTDPGSDPTASFSLCEGLPPFNNLYWANYACKDPEKCVYNGGPANVEESSGPIGPTCAAGCNPGTTACISPGNGNVGGIVTVGEATITCKDDGTWDYAKTTPCTAKDSRELWCGPNLLGTADNFNVGTCMEPACAAWFASFDTFTLPDHYGACGTDGKFYPCNADGSFGDPQDCSDCQLATGITLPAQPSTPETYAGYEPGTCVACTQGAQRCLFSTSQLSGTPYYQVCDKGSWTTQSCSGNKLCWGYQNPEDGAASIKCGAQCAPFTAQCGGTDGKQIATCDKDGTLGAFKNCATGACHTDSVSSTSGGSATCETECIEGTSQCVSVIDPDTSLPAEAAAVCTPKGRFDVANATICNAGDLQNPEHCFANVGCAQCDSGAFDGVPDVRCALDENGVPTATAAVQVCKPNGTWDKAIDCPGGGTVSCSLGVCYATEPPSGEGGAGGQTGGGGGGSAGVLQ